jgi:fermentation-respiration switch protein FrsA (DUF1100 family)
MPEEAPVITTYLPVSFSRISVSRPVEVSRWFSQIVHGDRDPLVPYHQSTLLADALRAAGVPVIFYTVVGAGHGGFNDPQIPVLVHQFLAAHLRDQR